jgi:hypothetical protein
MQLTQALLNKPRIRATNCGMGTFSLLVLLYSSSSQDGEDIDCGLLDCNAM